MAFDAAASRSIGRMMSWLATSSRGIDELVDLALGFEPGDVALDGVIVHLPEQFYGLAVNFAVTSVSGCR